MLYGLDIGGTKMELAVLDLEHNKIVSKRLPTPTDSYDAFKKTSGSWYSKPIVN